RTWYRPRYIAAAANATSAHAGAHRSRAVEGCDREGAPCAMGRPYDRTAARPGGRRRRGSGSRRGHPGPNPAPSVPDDLVALGLVGGHQAADRLGVAPLRGQAFVVGPETTHQRPFGLPPD